MLRLYVCPSFFFHALSFVIIHAPPQQHPVPDGVFLDDIDSCSPLVRRSLPENVSYVRARDNLQGSAAHPNSEGELQILPAPNIHARIVGAYETQWKSKWNALIH